jgi:hypothetical protein
MPSDTINADVLILRLSDNDTPAALQGRIEQSAGALPGELLAWLEGRWFYLSGGSEALLAGKLGAGAPGLLAAGAAEVGRIPLAEFETRLARRADKPQYLRDAAANGVALPSVVGDTVTHNGRAIALDWQITISGVHRAWAMFDPTPGALPWAGIRVGHIDTGCTRHPALGFSGDTSGFVRSELGKNLFGAKLVPPQDPSQFAIPPEESGPFDNLTGGNGGHGTRTLSTLAGFYDTADPGSAPFYGAAPGAEVIPYRVTDSILIDAVQDLLAAAIDDAIGQGCRVLSMSLGGIVPRAILARAIDNAYEKGIIVCAAAGNVISEVTYPGRYNRVVTLGGASPAGAAGFVPWQGASRGQYVDVCGPADGIRRASAERRNGQIVPFITAGGNGTSYATALCAGIAALWLAKREQDLAASYGPPHWRWPAAFKQLLKTTAACPAGWDTANWGRGLYQADKLLAAGLPPKDTLHQEAKAAAPFDPAS